MQKNATGLLPALQLEQRHFPIYEIIFG